MCNRLPPQALGAKTYQRRKLCQNYRCSSENAVEEEVAVALPDEEAAEESIATLGGGGSSTAKFLHLPVHFQRPVGMPGPRIYCKRRWGIATWKDSRSDFSPVKDLPLPYLDPTAKGDNLKFGISFASGGPGLLNSTSELQNVAKVNLQISWFREYKDKLKIVLGTEQKATQFLNDALYFIGEGSNDYAFKSLNLAEIQLSKELPGSQFIYLDNYAIFMDIIQNKFKYGFQVINRGCCGTGLIEFGQLCNPLVGACDDGSLYVYFDAAHGSLATYNITATKLRAQLESEFGVMF
ncbi:GDSL esterase/lipase At2g31540 [Selaginella moellendorffii]|uniref:GDSL esterase/lipase At2g31540 n=1 Tax=Selaginella moellendorffii TaxID=88036 RepID=UPI000D1C82D0|nr:GDSL esterase/lipase At2g31540 [Selaginella moellendorffii]|eukprot:XP_024535532.1 GDSL esterase/lipase At2g31540 [Selaginella moellendorffii]